VSSQELAKLVNREPSGSYNDGHRIGVHRIVPRNCYNSRAVGHYNVSGLTRDPESGLLERFHRTLMRHAGNWHTLALENDLA